nr:XRE family transcriptional regulator [Tsukamurella asaccharolytica]
MRTPRPETVAVGRRIRGLRTARGYSMSYLAQLAGISQPYLSQLENATASPSLATLITVARALSVEPGDLLTPSPGSEPADPPAIETAVTTPVTRERFAVIDDQGPQGESLTRAGADARLTAYLHTFDPAAPERGWFCHPGEDFIYVLSGSITLELQGEPPVRLDAGDTVHHAGTTPHRCAPVGPGTATTLLVCARELGDTGRGVDRGPAADGIDAPHGR